MNSLALLLGSRGPPWQGRAQCSELAALGSDPGPHGFISLTWMRHSAFLRLPFLIR